MILNIELSESEAMALAQFVKRAGWHEFRGCAVDDEEAYLIRDAISKTQDALSEIGYSPR